MLVLLNVFGVLLAIPRLLFWNSFEADTVIMNLLWTLFNLALLGAVLLVAAVAITLLRKGAASGGAAH